MTPVRHMSHPDRPRYTRHGLGRVLMTLLLATGLLIFFAAAMAAGVKPVPKRGACPPGYSTSGAYCVPREKAKRAIEKQGACPAGYHTSGNYCVGGDRARDAVPKIGACPPGYQTNGSYCLKRK